MVNDFAPVALITEVPIVLVVRKDLPATTLREFVEYARANQAKMQDGSAVYLGGSVVLNAAIGTMSRTAARGRWCRISSRARGLRVRVDRQVGV